MTKLQQVRFIGLAPKTENRKAVELVLSRYGSIQWMKFLPLRLKSYPETKPRSLEALANAAKPAKTVLGRWLKSWLYSMQYNWARSLFEKNQDIIAICWNGLNGSRKVFMDAAKDAGCKTLFFELAPFKGRLTIDPVGVNYANSLPRNIDFYLQHFNKDVPDEYAEFYKTISQRKSANANFVMSQTNSIEVNYLFLPLQVSNDSQLRVFGGEYKSLDILISRLREILESLPEGWYIRVKEHPSSKLSLSDQLLELSDLGLVLDNYSDTFEQVKKSKGVITINSSVGLESMFFDVPVIALGKAFWAIEGLAIDGSNYEKLKKLLSSPDKLTFSKEGRDAFLNYLLTTYYPEVNGINKITSKKDNKLKRLNEIIFNEV